MPSGADHITAGHITAALQQAPQTAGFHVTVDSSHTLSGGDFARVQVTRRDQST